MPPWEGFAMAPNSDALEPNLFELRSADLQVTYATTSFTGEPQFSYTPTGGDALNFMGDEIRPITTALGVEVTVTLREVPDLGVTIFTLLIPPIVLTDEGGVRLETVGITTTQRTSIAGPPPGQQYTYEVESLAGEASFVLF
jgi:hypothetical protein